ncbi:MAG: DMT family transporter [Spirochaetaceae bacterium]|jgi:drug/metabolite transporter (DMT)-like permease|nr:DMT family transporter [Spirochaetaceae bacterium]
MDRRVIKADILLGLTACIWGFAFAAQRAGMNYIGPFTFNSIRFLLGGVALVPLVVLRDKRAREMGGGRRPDKLLFIFSVAAGGCLFTGASLQQLGLLWTTAGNSGFLTGIYVILVPVFGIFMGRKTGMQTWAGAVLALAGLFFVIGGVNLETVNSGDILTIVSGIFWALHVILIDRFVRKTDAVKLACGQFVVCGLISLVFALLNIPGRLNIGIGAELGAFNFHPSMMIDAAVPLLYGGIMSVGVAYTLQVVAQRDAPPAHAAVILCTESVFAAIGGILLLSEKPGPAILLGFFLMLAGMLATQWDVIMRRPVEKKEAV